MMEIDLQGWWEICQIAGAGAALVLGPLSVVLWRENRENNQYIRNADKDQLKVLTHLSNVIDKSKEDNEKGLQEFQTSLRDLHKAIGEATDRITRHIDSKIK